MVPRKRFRPLELMSPTHSKRKVQKPLQEKTTNLRVSPLNSKIGKDIRSKESRKTRKTGSENIFNSKHVDLRMESALPGLNFVSDSQKSPEAPEIRCLSNKSSHTLKNERQTINTPLFDNSLRFEDIEQPPKSTSTPVLSQSSQINLEGEPPMFSVPYYIAPSPMYNLNPYQNFTGNPIFFTPYYNPSLNYAIPIQRPELLYPNVNMYGSPLLKKARLPPQVQSRDKEQNFEYLPIFPVSISNNGDFVGQEMPRLTSERNKRRLSNSLDVDCSEYESSGQKATCHDSRSSLE